MGKDPAVLFYTADFLAGTMFMRNEQVGKYIKLLCMQHQQGHLREEDMLEMCGTYDERIFSKFAKDEQGLYYNERMEEETEKRRKYSESRSNNRKKKKNEDVNGDVSNTSKTYVRHMENENENINGNIIKNKIDYSSFIDLYNTQCFNLSSVLKVTDKRKKAIANFLKQLTFEDFENACIKANNNDFLTGNNDRGWKADFDFIIKPDNAAKIIEGRYESQSTQTENDKFFDDLRKYREGIL